MSLDVLLLTLSLQVNYHLRSARTQQWKTAPDARRTSKIKDHKDTSQIKALAQSNFVVREP